MAKKEKHEKQEIKASDVADLNDVLAAGAAAVEDKEIMGMRAQTAAKSTPIRAAAKPDCGKCARWKGHCAARDCIQDGRCGSFWPLA